MSYTRKYDEEHYFDRDLSWLEFNQRVLAESMDDRVPLLERLIFMDIYRSNNDEFFMKRVGALHKKTQLSDEGIYGPAQDLLSEFRDVITGQLEQFSKNYNKTLLPTLEKEGILLLSWDQLNNNDKELLKEYFKSQIYPILTPLAVDRGHPFPFLSNLSKSIGVVLSDSNDEGFHFARVKIPTEINQWIKLKPTKTALRFINLDSIIKANLDSLFPGMTITNSFIFRVTRNAALSDDGDDAEDKMGFVEEGLRERKFAPVVRLEYESKADQNFLNYLKQELSLTDDFLYEITSLPNYTKLSEVYKYGGKAGKYKHFSPTQHAPLCQAKTSKEFFDLIKKKDQLVHFPFDSFGSSVEAMVKFAADDPKVQGIKIVLYRTDSDGKIINALIKAAENKKQVACIIELTARFDEERNIHWAQKLEEAGVHVSYGLMEYKTHAKMISVVRKEKDGIRTYVNIGTGNFNSQTSKVYTDMGYFTCHYEISREVLEIFNYLTGRSEKLEFKKLLVAPFNMYETFLKSIKNETKLAKQGNAGIIVAKMNQLEDPGIIDALYEASQAGVKITLYVRGFCCLVPGLKGVSDNIKIYSLVGRFLEHSRIYYFSKGKQSDPLKGDFYMGSADWMSRNLHDRVEVITKIAPATLKSYLWNYLDQFGKDNRHLWELKNYGKYAQVKSSKKVFNIQEEMIKLHSSALAHLDK